ncbi:MAG TPA: CapA family protein [Chthoniobacteraceae bacterium]|nr:CapA family protein [Chthoniobacteraceae bacterium]
MKMNLFEPTEKKGHRVTIASDWAPIWTYEALMEADPLAVYGDLLPLLRGSDLNIVNVECVLGEKGAPIPKAGPCLRGDEKVALAALTQVPFHVATLANNHSMDYGPESLEETLALLRGAGIRTVGAAMNGEEAACPLIIENDRLRLGIINCGEGEACASLAGGPGAYVFDLEVQEAQIRALKGEVDAVVVIFHGGREHAPMPPPYVVRALRRFAEAGAAAVIAHHPHVPQGLEVHAGVPIAYSQGNFVFRREVPSYYRNTGYLVHLDFDAKKEVNLSITPYRLKPEGVFVLRGEEQREFLAELEAISRYLADPRAIADLWDAFGDEYGDGEKTVISQLERGLEEYGRSRESAIARWHHYFFAPAHQQYFENAFERLKRGTFGTSPEWAREWVRRWKERELEG